MSGFPPIIVRQPAPFDIVDDPVDTCGIAAGFEGIVEVRVLDANGAQLARTGVPVGISGLWHNFHAAIPIGTVPGTPGGTVHFSLGAREDDPNDVIVPVAFGPALIDPYQGFEIYTVVSGDTLWDISERLYGDPTLYPRLFEANRDIIDDPDLIFPGQVLRVPR